LGDILEVSSVLSLALSNLSRWNKLIKVGFLSQKGDPSVKRSVFSPTLPHLEKSLN
jgi:hypothetical protein